MDTRKHESQPVEPIDWGAEPFSWLRKRNQRRDRIAELMRSSKPARASHVITAPRPSGRNHAR
jgi:hypothetical protein